MPGKITENTTLEEVLKYPAAAIVLRQHGIPCPTCPLARAEMSTLRVGNIARMYGADLKALLKALNEAVEKSSGRPHCCR